MMKRSGIAVLLKERGGAISCPSCISVYLQLTDFSGFLVFPITPRLKRKVKLYGAGTRTVIGTTSAIPAFFRVKDNRRLALLRMRYIHIDLACFHTNIAAVADFRIEQYRLIRRRDIWDSK
jgi:hypothetical protein